MNGLPDLSRYYRGNLEALKGRKDPEAVRVVAREMETLFAYQLVKAMRETTGAMPKSGFGSDTYMSIFDMELSRLIADRGLGLQEILLKGMERSGTIKEISQNSDKGRNER